MRQEYKIYYLKDNHNIQRFIDLIKKKVIILPKI